MRKTLFGIIILAGILTFSCAQKNKKETKSLSQEKTEGLDLINPYDLNIEGVKLFGEVHPQMNLFGMPVEIMRQNSNIDFNTKEDIVNAIENSNIETIVRYTGIEFWCFNDLESIPCKIDFRKLGKKVINGSLNYSNNYKLNDFKTDYPNSYRNSPQMPQSFFRMATQESEGQLKHYYVERSTKSDPNVKLLVEFTFKEDKLIYMFFANF